MAKNPQMAILEGDGSFPIEVVGESHHFQQLRSIAGPCDRNAVEVVKTAYVVPEPSNKVDPNALRVEVDHNVIGYLPKPTAAQLAPVLRRAKLVAVQVQARISAFAGADNYSVWLDGNLDELIELPSPDRPWWRVW